MDGRIAIEDVRPAVGGGAFPAKAVTGEPVSVRATVWHEGHAALGAEVVLRGPSGPPRTVPLRLADPGLDRWAATVVADAPGPWTFQVVAWRDPWATWTAGLRAKLDAGLTGLDNELEEGARLLDRAAGPAGDGAERPGTPAGRGRLLRSAAAVLRRAGRPPAARAEAALSGSVQAAMAEAAPRELVTHGPVRRLRVDRPRARYGSWYEFFPRSTGGRRADGTPVHGTLRTAVRELPRIAAMGFDVVYLPPVHPIGTVHRKGRDNALTAAPGDVGSPWAVGSADGGHDAVHPDLGTVEDFVHFVERARAHGLEVALDLALQCAPDHPWVTEHPEWFSHRPDGSIAYAENPPKKYQDIYPLDFDNAPESLYAEILRIVRLWIDRGVRIFRVDNPHTKPVAFWSRLIDEIGREFPDVFFLAEAFTRPAVLKGLARRGFAQSYTYFTWRETKRELTEYLEELVADGDFLRPNFFVNTPDILPVHLQTGGPGAFAVRAALAATLSPSWGVYAGYELYEGEPLRATGNCEEYAHSEKYELRPRDWAAARAAGRSLEPWLTLLNSVRRAHPALQQLRTLRFHATDNDALIAYSKTDPATGDTVLCVVGLTPDAPEKGTVTLDAEGPRLPDGPVTDAVTGERLILTRRFSVGTDPLSTPARILTWSRK
ncbi:MULTISPECIES: alpha-1,4-glucan--maltose-1-phosphate maltosyltransferase [Streptomyces]|uniref:alpha-1,4-glucan--maltose-1-phosphate maltosyltransferase n=1 Tax=Streptomyces TaxID=1883 RepID=UPI0033BD4BE3